MITDKQIKNLRREAAEAGDLVQVHVCDVALGLEEPIETAEQWEERYGGGGFDASERRAITAVGSQEQAREMCAKAIAGVERGE